MVKYSNAYNTSTESNKVKKNYNWGLYVKKYPNREITFEQFVLNNFKRKGYKYNPNKQIRTRK